MLGAHQAVHAEGDEGQKLGEGSKRRKWPRLNLSSDSSSVAAGVSRHLEQPRVVEGDGDVADDRLHHRDVPAP